MADSYIHFTYARNLANHQEYTYNLGSSEGIGSTSFLWVLILAMCQAIGIPPETSAVALGIGLLAFTGILVYDITVRLNHDMPQRKQLFISVTAAMLTVIPGSMVWLALSGMETILFLFLSLLSLRLYALKRWVLLGLVLGLLAITRTEGLILAVAIALVEGYNQRRIPKELVWSAIPALIFLVPWMLYLLSREGIFATASYQGRMVMIVETNARIASQLPALKWLITVNPLVYLFSWSVLLLLYISGAAGMPGPLLDLNQSLLGTKMAFSVLGGLVGLVVCLPLLILAVRRIWQLRHNLSLEKPAHRLLAVVLSWTMLHNLAYGLFISHTGAAGRYAPMNHVLFWIALVIGAWSISNKALRTITTAFVAVLLFVSLVYWQRVYAANIEYSQRVRIAAAEYIDTQIPPQALVGATDLGPIRYFARQPIVDLIGHVNKDIGPFLEAGGDFADYLHQKGICYLMLYGAVGEAGLDFADEMKLTDDDRFDLITEARFEIPIDIWRLGSEPLRDYMPAMDVYRVDWHAPGVCDSTSGQD